MADPVTLGVAAAGVGAMVDKDNPLRGAALGGLGGWGGGTLMGLGAAGGAGAGGLGAGAANNALYSALPGLSGSVPGSQAAMLAAQTAEFGTPGLLSTGAALSPAGSTTGAAFGAANNLMGGNNASRMFQAGMQLKPRDQQQPQMASASMMSAPPIQRPQQPTRAPRPYGGGMAQGDTGQYTFPYVPGRRSSFSPY